MEGFRGLDNTKELFYTLPITPTQQDNLYDTVRSASDYKCREEEVKSLDLTSS